MKDQNKCFILGADGYEEITYSELKHRRETEECFARKWFIRSGFMLMEASESDYKNFIRDERRQKYVDYESVRAGAFSLDELDTDEMLGSDILIDPAPPIDEAVEDKLMRESVISCLDMLNTDDRKIIEKTFFDGLSERELAKELGIPRMTLVYRKAKALDKIKEMMKT